MPRDARLPSWITPGQFEVLTMLVTLLDERGIPYQASGGLAGNLHGSRWPLHDIDLDVPATALPALAGHFGSSVRFGPAPYRDDEFELELLTLELEGVMVDLSAAESIGLRRPDGAHVPWPVDLACAEGRRVAGLAVRVTPLDNLVAYKRVIGRTRDLHDLEALRALPDASLPAPPP